MPYNMNLNGAATFSVAGGYPVRLLPAVCSSIVGVIPAVVTSVSATVQTESGTANAHIALQTMPTTVGGSDGAIVAQTDITGLSTSAQTMTVSVPSGVLPVPYVVRIWVDSITGFAAETISRDGSTLASALPNIPTAVKLTNVTVS